MGASWRAVGLLGMGAASLVGCGGASAPPSEPEPWFTTTEPAEGEPTAATEASDGTDRAEAGDDSDASVAPSGEGGTPPANTITVERLEVDGVVLERVECRVDGLGLLGALVVAQVFSARRAELTRCIPGGAPIEVRWSFEDGQVLDASLEGAPAVQGECVRKALVGGPAPGRGSCSAQITPP